MSTLTIILLTWYFAGALIGLFLYHKCVPYINNIDVFLFLTLGGLFGFITVIIGILFLLKHGSRDDVAIGVLAFIFYLSIVFYLYYTLHTGDAPHLIQTANPLPQMK